MTNKLVNVSLRDRLLFIGDRDEIQVFRLLTMKEYLDEMNE